MRVSSMIVKLSKTSMKPLDTEHHHKHAENVGQSRHFRTDVLEARGDQLFEADDDHDTRDGSKHTVDIVVCQEMLEGNTNDQGSERLAQSREKSILLSCFLIRRRLIEKKQREKWGLL